MAWMPEEAEFGHPIAVLHKSELVLFENGTLAEYRKTPAHGLEATSTTTRNQAYDLYYNHISELASIKRIQAKWPSVLQQVLMKRNRALFTGFLGLILAGSYFLSTDYSQLPIVRDLSEGWRLFVCLIILFTFVPLEFNIRDILLRYHRAEDGAIQVNLVHRNNPVNIHLRPRTWKDELYDWHNGTIRFVILLAMFDLPGSGNFETDFLEFLELVIGFTILPYVFFVLYVPFHFLQLTMNKRRGYIYVQSLNSDQFFRLCQEKIASAKPMLEAQRDKTLSELISIDETATLEFKGSLWTTYNTRTYEPIEQQNKKSLELQDAVVKSIAAFLNTDGGTLLVGVKDKPHEREDPISGIENDFRFLGKDKSIEGFGHAMIQLLNDAFGDQTTVKLYVSISYPRMNEKTVCRVDVKPLPRVRNGEMWTKTKTMGAEEFFYRVSDTTTHASAKSANRYIRHHFEGFSEPVDD